MVHYIGEKPGRLNLNWKQYSLIGAACLAFMGIGLRCAFSGRNEEDAIVHATETAIASDTGYKQNNEKAGPKTEPVETIEQKLDSVLTGLQEDPESMSQNYSKLAEAVKKGLEEHPDYANQFIRAGLEALKQKKIDKDTYMAIFEQIRKKAEEEPELMDHFGENARTYMEKKIVDQYLGTVEDAFRDAASGIKENSKPVIEALGMAKDYLIKKLQEE
jgi:hypothetical protein